MKICIDPGHGGKDPGAVGPTGVAEAHVVLDVSLYLETLLRDFGLETVLTRRTDVFIELSQRCHIANKAQADFFVSIHANSDGPQAIGIETLYKTGDGKALAEPVQRRLIEATEDVDRGLKQRSDLYVLNGTGMPAILPEIGFISNPDTEFELKTADYQQLIAQAIRDGIVEFLQIPLPTSPPPID